MFSWEKEKNSKRKPFPISRKKIEWMRAIGKDPFGTFVTTSKCRKCSVPLKWGERSYEFDHKNNDNTNNNQIVI